MPALSTLVGRSELGLRFLTDGPAETEEIESALIANDADLPVWVGTDPDLFRRVLLILPFSGEGSPAQAEATMRRLKGVVAGGVVLAMGPGGRDVEAPTALAYGHETPLLVAAGESHRVWAEVMEIIREERDDSTDHLREMQRAVTRPDGLERLIRWLARRVSGRVVLLDRSGVPRHSFPEIPADVIEQAADDIQRVVSGEASAAAADIDAGVVHIQSIGERTRDAALVVARPGPFSAQVRNLIGDASRLLSLRWSAEDAGRRQQAMDRAEMHAREAVLHLLMVGELQAARRVAETLGPSLAEEIRVYVVECPPDARDQSVAHCDRASGGKAWVVRCPIYTRHVIVLAPAPETANAMDETLRRYAGRSTGVDVGRSHTVPLPEMASGYGQAFHALAVARGNAEHYAVFSPLGDLAALVRPNGYEWARAELKPLRDYRPDRVQDPDAAELTATLQSWLDFYGGAARQLKIHRNTLSNRLRRIEKVLGCSLNDLETQSRLHLALRVLDGSGGIAAARSLEAVLGAPDVRHWVGLQVYPLVERDSGLFLETLRAWLRNDARLEPTASALGISVPGARKRLIRIEEMLGRSLLNGPSARYDLWFALKVYDA